MIITLLQIEEVKRQNEEQQRELNEIQRKLREFDRILNGQPVKERVSVLQLT